MKCGGFSLIELLFCLLLLSLLAVFSLPSLSVLSQKNEQLRLIDELNTAVHYAKIQALSLGHSVYLRPSDASDDWSKGMALTQWNKKTKHMEVLHVWQYAHSNWRLHWSGVNVSAQQVTFSANPMNAISNGRFLLEDLHGKRIATLILNRLGRIRVS